MQLSDKDIQRIVYGLLNENRIEKLKLQKYPDNIIKFAYDFALATTRDTSQEPNILSNQYIPWIAEQAKKNPEIMDKKEELSTIIAWIEQSGYNKINSIESFEGVYNKAKQWLEKKALKLKSDKNIEGIHVIHKFPDGSKIVKVENINWCINVGTEKGWCFNKEERANEFIGIGQRPATSYNRGVYNDKPYQTEGYMIVDSEGSPQLAIQYDKETGVIDDFQGAHNKVPEETVVLKSIELFKKFKIINDIKSHTNHGDTFWDSIKKYPSFWQAFRQLKNLHLSLDKQFYFQIPFTKEQIANMSVAEKHKYGVATSQEIKKLSNFTKNILTILQNPQAEPKESLFLPQQLEGFSDIEFEDDKMKLNMPIEEYEKYYSGLDEDGIWTYNVVTSHDYYEDMDSNELEYMYNYLNEENKAELSKIAIMVGAPNYNFEDEGNLEKFLKKYMPSEYDDITNRFLGDLGYASAKGRSKAVNAYLDKYQKFKYENGYLILPYKDLYNFLIDHPGIQSFKDLKEAEINGDISGVSEEYNQAPYDEGELKDLDRNFEQNLEKFVDKLEEEGTDYSSAVNTSKDILNGLGFVKNKLFKNNRYISIEEIDYFLQKYKINYKEYPASLKLKTLEQAIESKAKPKKQLKGWIGFDSLTNYVHNKMMFEAKDIIKNIFEDFRFLYDKNLTPPIEVSTAAQNAINVVSKNKLVSQDGSNEGSGLKKAKTLAARQPLNHGQLKRMKAFFDNNAEAVRNEKATGKNINNSPLIQKWELWGGDAGKNWADKQINATQSSNQTSKKIRNPEDGLRTKNLMNPNNTRIHRESLSNFIGQIFEEAFVNPKGQLKAFYPPKDLTADEPFERLRSKWNVEPVPGKRVGIFGSEYWFPTEAEQDLLELGIDWYKEKIVPGKGAFLVFAYTPKKL